MVSHATALPFYYLEPMRIAVIFVLILTGSRTNAYFLALTLPIFSHLISGHPDFLKSGLISTELCLNIAFFDLFSRFTKKNIPCLDHVCIV